jgi:hypothetical protein
MLLTDLICSIKSNTLFDILANLNSHAANKLCSESKQPWKKLSMPYTKSKATWLEIQLPRTFYEQLPESAAIAQNTLRIETTKEKRLTK